MEWPGLPSYENQILFDSVYAIISLKLKNLSTAKVIFRSLSDYMTIILIFLGRSCSDPY